MLPQDSSTVMSINLPHKNAFAQRMLIVPDVSKEGYEHLNINDAVKFRHFEFDKNVDVLRTGFRIIIPGNYCVYSHVLYTPKKLCSQLTTKYWTQRTMMTPPGEATKARILKSSQYNCTINTVIVKEDSYIGTVEYLDVGDILHVEVSWQAPLEKESRNNYFGLFLIGSGTFSFSPPFCEGMAPEA